MQVTFHDNLDAFRERAMPRLLAHEEMNCLMLGYLRRAPEFSVLATVETSSDVIAAAARVGPHNLLITPGHPAAAEVLADALWQRREPLPGVQASADVANAFADTWRRLGGGSARRIVRLALYALEQVNGLLAPPGAFRAATLDDLPALSAFTRQFGIDINEPVADPENHTRMLIEQDRLFVWTDDASQPVSMAAWAGPTPNGVRVNHVFTPKEHRGQGYATACVAKLSQYLLASGRRFVCLFADQANDTSNGIYRRIGYRALGEQVQLAFDPK